jgi:hypothetical protein
VRLCFDCCHFSVEHEDPIVALDRIRAAGVQIGRIQLSSALRVSMPADRAGASRVSERLRRFADTTYLHQVICRHADGFEHFADLDEALARGVPGDWRVHFHVPLFTSEYDGLGSTQDDVRAVLGWAAVSRATRHLEIETYTWDVLPAGLKVDIVESIAREYGWVLGALAEAPPVATP